MPGVRILILSDVAHTATLGLIRGTLRAADARPGWSVRALVTTRPEAFAPGPTRVLRTALRRGVVIATTRRQPYGRGMPLGHELPRELARRGVPVEVPPGGDVHAPAFLARIRDELRPDLTLSFYCVHILRPEFLDVAGRVVNFHDGLLPAYRGLYATAFSILDDAGRSGFTYHWIDVGLDTGPVLADGAVPVGPGDCLTDVTRRKVRAAVAALPAVLDRAAAGDPGRPQSGAVGYRSGADGRAMRTVADPGALTADDLERRVRAFSSVDIAIDGRTIPVTRLRRGPGRDAFTTSDGVVLRPDRIMGIPTPVHRAVTAARRVTVRP